MAGLGIAPGDVINTVREQNIEVSAGQVGAPPVPVIKSFNTASTPRAA
ncbi:hypothetical protein METH_08535 [Leisingera methylohalidivorans DSM 14336]|uniref:Uncharacterized protein n=1 Tax=Leisingera methylohalidivorans DSM 14336 TaxID=999552 RepID=V9VZ09_9RHOB|nr:hypothetical protein METH_08535 [Leisingera methylohalidivorans DSM 14336]